MQMLDREDIDGTEPSIYIGRRVYQRPDGSFGKSKVWHAEYTLESRQRSKALGTANKAAAIRAAHALCEKLRNGIDEKPLKRIKVGELKELYLEVLVNRGRSPKTMTKDRFNLNEFTDWWEAKGDKHAATFTPRDFWAYRKAFGGNRQEQPHNRGSTGLGKAIVQVGGSQGQGNPDQPDRGRVGT